MKNIKKAIELLNYIDLHKKECCIKNKNKCDNELNCTKCLIASSEACDAPEINKLINTVYTIIPNSFSFNNELININDNVEYCFNYYIKLPRISYNEIRLLWPVIWMIPELIQKLQGKFIGSGNITIKFLLNILSKKIIKAPAQNNLILNTGFNSCMNNSAIYDYTFNFPLISTTGTSILNNLLPWTLTFSVPNNPIFSQFVIDPNTYDLISQDQENFINLSADTIYGFGQPLVNGGAIIGVITSLGATSSQIDELRVFLEPLADRSLIATASGTIITLISGSSSYVFPVPNIVISTSVAQYISFVSSCERGKCENYWISTNLF